MLNAQDPKYQKFILAAQAFTPSTPIDKEEFFAGRQSELHRIANAVIQKGQHVILFGERGVGKTSLANIVPVFLQNAGVNGIYSGVINCDGEDDFSSIWRKVFKQFTFQKNIKEIGFLGSEKSNIFSLNDLFPASHQLKPEEIRLLIQNTFNKSIIIIDEVDRITNKSGDNTTTLLADTIKTLSDHNVDTTLIFIGVADSVAELIEKHFSVERCLIQIKLPRMSSDELIKIIDNGLNIVEMAMDDVLKKFISYLSKGRPNYTHLLSLYSVQRAILRNKDCVTLEDLTDSVYEALENEQLSISALYEKAVISNQETLYPKILLACALAETNQLGYFTTSDVRTQMCKIMGRDVDIPTFSRQINKFCSPKKGSILIKNGEAGISKYRFTNPLLQPYIVIKGFADGLISPNDIAANT